MRNNSGVRLTTAGLSLFVTTYIQDVGYTVFEVVRHQLTCNKNKYTSLDMSTSLQHNGYLMLKQLYEGVEWCWNNNTARCTQYIEKSGPRGNISESPIWGGGGNFRRTVSRTKITKLHPLCFLWVRASWISVTNCPTRCDYIRLLYFCKMPYMFRVLTPPIIRSTYNCNYSIWHW
jgi:hypothetical protein